MATKLKQKCYIMLSENIKAHFQLEKFKLWRDEKLTIFTDVEFFKIN